MGGVSSRREELSSLALDRRRCQNDVGCCGPCLLSSQPTLETPALEKRAGEQIGFSQNSSIGINEPLGGK